MPELPEVEVLVRHLDPLVRGLRVRGVNVRREKVLRPTTPQELGAVLTGTTLQGVTRRAKFLVFQLRNRNGETVPLVAHLGMTGRIFLQAKREALPKHTAVSLDTGAATLVFEDTRYFGRFTLDASVLNGLGPEPLDDAFDVDAFGAALKRSTQPVKVKLLDQTLIAGVGNIYASESLYRAGISPKRRSDKLKPAEVVTLVKCIQEVLREAIQFGSTIPLDHAGTGPHDGLFYYGKPAGTPDFYEERLLVYDRFNQPCIKCETPIKRFVQATRSTYFCPTCQRR